MGIYMGVRKSFFAPVLTLAWETVLKIKTNIRSGRTHDNRLFQKYMKAIKRYSSLIPRFNHSNNVYYAKTAVAGVRG